MQVILIEDVKGKGKKGDVINVSPGYGQNFLLKNKLAVEADKNNMAKLKNNLKNEKIELEAKINELKEIAEVIKKTKIVLQIRVGKEGKTFGKISSKQIIEELNKSCNCNLPKKVIMLDHDLNSVGFHEFNVDLGHNIKFTTKLEIKGQ